MLLSRLIVSYPPTILRERRLEDEFPSFLKGLSLRDGFIGRMLDSLPGVRPKYLFFLEIHEHYPAFDDAFLRRSKFNNPENPPRLRTLPSRHTPQDAPTIGRSGNRGINPARNRMMEAQKDKNAQVSVSCSVANTYVFIALPDFRIDGQWDGSQLCKLGPTTVRDPFGQNSGKLWLSRVRLTAVRRSAHSNGAHLDLI